MTFITYDVAAIDGKNHQVKLYYDNTAEVCAKGMTTLIDITCSPILSTSRVINVNVGRDFSAAPVVMKINDERFS